MEQVFYIDLKNITTKESLHEAIKRELPLPDHYGNNLDAFYDVLTEAGDGWNVIFYNMPGENGSLTACDSEFSIYLSKLKKLCTRAASECDDLKIRFYP